MGVSKNRGTPPPPPKSWILTIQILGGPPLFLETPIFSRAQNKKKHKSNKAKKIFGSPPKRIGHKLQKKIYIPKNWHGTCQKAFPPKKIIFQPLRSRCYVLQSSLKSSATFCGSEIRHFAPVDLCVSPFTTGFIRLFYNRFWLHYFLQ